jgi:antitoxin component of MazEF toxin-antitoxin module
MLFSMLRTFGGSVVLAIPKPILEGLGLSANTRIGLSVSGGRLIVEPHPRPRYTLSELVLVPHELEVAADRPGIDLEVPRQRFVGWPFPRSQRLVDRLHPPHQRPRAGMPHRRRPRSPASLAVVARPFPTQWSVVRSPSRRSAEHACHTLRGVQGVVPAGEVAE